MRKLSQSLIFATIVCLTGCSKTTPQVVDEYVHCRSLAGDRTALKLLAWEFDAVSEAIKSSCPQGKEFTEAALVAEVSKQLDSKLRDSLRDAEASIKTTLLELEVRGVYVRSDVDDGGNGKLRRA